MAEHTVTQINLKQEPCFRRKNARCHCKFRLILSVQLFCFDTRGSR